MKKKQPKIAICTFELKPGQDIQIFPDGEFRADDGRPEEVDAWIINSSVAAALLLRADARQRDTVIDYEHQSFYTTGAAPAAGWYHDLAYREGEGVFVTDARWTDKASAHIEADEYRYISPTFAYDPDTGHVLRVLSLALTNDPAIDGMREVETLAAAKFNLNLNDDEENTMNELLLAALGLDATATEDEVIAACKKLTAENETLKADAESSKEKIAALTTKVEKSGDVDLSQYAPVAVVDELKEQIAALTTKANENEVDEIIAAAKADGKLLPAQEDWARKLGESNIESLKSYVENTSAVAALSNKQTEQDDLNLDKDGNVVLSEEQIALCKNMGLSEESYIATLKQQSS